MGKNKSFPLRIEHLWCLTVIVGVFIFVNTHPIRPHDFWWHIAVGKEIVETHTIPNFDKYSFTMFGQPYPSYKMFWLMETFLYSIFNLGGPALIVFVQSLMITAAYTLIILICYSLTASWRIAAIGGMISAALGLNDWNVRPQTITFLLGAITLWAIYSYRRKVDWRYLPVIPVALMVWVNSHGTFPLGLVIIGIWFADELVIYLKRRGEGTKGSNSLMFSTGTLIISTIVLLLNPRGIGIFNYLSTMSSNKVVQNLVVEWAPPSINSLLGALFFSALLILAVIMAISPRRPNTFEILTFLIFSILGISTSRGVIWFGLVSAPVFSQHIDLLVASRRKNVPAGKSQESVLMNGILGVFLILLAFLSLPWFKENLPLPTRKAGLISQETPVQATEYLLKQGLPMQVFHAMSFGSYLIWAAQAEYKVFVDPRIELYPPELWQDYLSISSAQDDWELKLERYGVNTLMLSPVEQALLLMNLQKSGQWKSVYKDDSAELFIRRAENK